ncbi:hypothetical protein AGMMS50262_13410 [Bacteroidia bacterium]|nr:hypothetical protein AGMMS50262_13410 [Bacteroidia bacterium]
MKQVKIILLIIASMLLCGCPNNEEGHRYITFFNKSKKDISCQDFWSGHITDTDTVFQCRMGAVGIPADSLCNFPSLNDSGWEEDFRAIPYIQFLVMDREVYKKNWNNPCDTIRKYVPILHCYRLTLEDLQRMNWTVIYPPEE